MSSSPRRLLQQRNLQNRDNFLIGAEGTPPPQLIELLRVQLMQWKDYAHQSGAQAGRPVTLTNELRVLQTLISAADQMLASLLFTATQCTPSTNQAACCSLAPHSHTMHTVN